MTHLSDPIGTPLLCACGSPDLISVAPGQEGEEIELLGTRIVMRAGVAAQAWCLACWPWARELAVADGDRIAEEVSC